MPNTNITVTQAQFIADFPEFATPGSTPTPNFPQSAFMYYLSLAVLLIDPSNRAATLANMMAELFIAHHLALEMLAAKDMNAGAVPGVAKGPIAGKSAGDVAISYVPGATLEMDAGHWNYTVYGQRFIRMVKMIGAGPVQIEGSCCLPGTVVW